MISPKAALICLTLLCGSVVRADEPQKTGWPLTEAERTYVLKPEYERRPGADEQKHLPALWPSTPSAGFWGGTSWLDTHAKLVENVKANRGPVDVLLVGDSITQQWGASWGKNFPTLKTVNIGIGGDKTQNVLWRLDHGGVEGLQPKVIVLMIGNNNMFFTPETGVEAAAKGVKACVDNLRAKFPKAEVIVAKILPAHAPGTAFYEDIKKTNAALDPLKLESDPKVHVLDLWSDFTQADGTLKKSLFTRDNIHLSPVGYAVYAERLKPLVKAFFHEELTKASIKPGQPWPDTKGVHINAHGFCILSHEGKYYWYGAHKLAGKTEDEKNEAGVRCYISSDLLSWTNAGLVLDVFAPGAHPELRDAFILDRPKVIFHTATKRFILYFKLYPPKEQGGKTGKDFAYVGVATSPTPTGPFEYQGRFLGAGSETGSGDFAIFQETDGAVYHIAVRKPDKGRKDKPLVCGRLSEDGLRPAGDYVAMAGVTNATEGPALFRRGGKYFLLGSASTGWSPNPARMFVADQLTGPYQLLGNPCRGVNPHNQLGPEKTFGGQSTFVFPMPGKPDEWIALFDINKPEDPVNAGYIWLPLQFESDKPVIEWRTEWNLESAQPPKRKPESQR